MPSCLSRPALVCSSVLTNTFRINEIEFQCNYIIFKSISTQNSRRIVSQSIKELQKNKFKQTNSNSTYTTNKISVGNYVQVFTSAFTFSNFKSYSLLKIQKTSQPLLCCLMLCIFISLYKPPTFQRSY